MWHTQEYYTVCHICTLHMVTTQPHKFAHCMSEGMCIWLAHDQECKQQHKQEHGGPDSGCERDDRHGLFIQEGVLTVTGRDVLCDALEQLKHAAAKIT